MGRFCEVAASHLSSWMLRITSLPTNSRPAPIYSGHQRLTGGKPQHPLPRAGLGLRPRTQETGAAHLSGTPLDSSTQVSLALSSCLSQVILSPCGIESNFPNGLLREVISKVGGTIDPLAYERKILKLLFLLFNHKGKGLTFSNI